MVYDNKHQVYKADDVLGNITPGSSSDMTFKQVSLT